MSICRVVCIGVCFIGVMSHQMPVSAHDGHKPLPTRGMEVDTARGRMILTKSARATLDVQTEDVQLQEVTSSIQTYGTLVSPWNRHAIVSSPLPGRVVALHVSPGATVSTGQVLAELESPELMSLGLEIRNAMRSLTLNQKLLESAEEAGRSGAVPEIRIIEAQNQVRTDRASLEIARAKLLSLQLSNELVEAILQNPEEVQSLNLPLKSPIDGTVSHSDLSVGKIISPKEHLLEVRDLSTLWLRVGVLEKDLARVSAGQALLLQLTAYPDRRIDSRIEVSGQFLDPQTHLGTVWASLSAAELKGMQLIPGMSGQVEIRTGTSEEKLTIPVGAVIRDGAERFVLVEEEQTQVASTYRKQSVVLGQRTGDRIEVRGGNVFPGDRVVTRGSHQMGGYFAKGVLKVSEETARDISLELTSVKQQEISETLTLDGLVDVPPTQRTVASAQLSGAISRILVDRGQTVKAGEILAEILSQDFQNLQLDFLRSQIDSELQQEVVDNLGSARDAVSQRRLWEAENRLNESTGLRESLRQQLLAAGVSREQIDDLAVSRVLLPAMPVRSPIAGVVMDFDKVLGHIVQPDEPVFEIHDLSKVWVQGFVSERELAKVEVGQSVRIRFVADENQVVRGTLVRSAQDIGSDNRTMSVWVELDEMPKLPIQHNMLARLTIETGKLPPTLAVPTESIVREGTRSFVFVRARDESFERRLVTPGRSDDTSIQILHGLSPGDLVVTGGAKALQTGYAALR